MRNKFVETLIKLARKDENIILLTADMGFGVFEKFKEEFEDRYYNIGISEQNMIGIAAGLALSGKKVYVYSIIPFLVMRPFEQIRIDIAYHNLDIKLVGVGGGFAYGPAGATHHSIEDIGIMRSLPNMKVYAPGDPVETGKIIEETYLDSSPTYIRLSRNNEKVIYNENDKFNIETATCLKNQNGEIAIISTGNYLEGSKNISEELSKKGMKNSLYSFFAIKPMDKKTLLKILKTYKYIYVLEEHNKYCGLYSSIMECVGEFDRRELNYNKIKSFSIEDKFSHFVGDQNYIRKCFCINEEKIIEIILKEIKKDNN